MSISKSFATVLNHSPGGTPAASRTTSTFDATGFTHILVGCKHENGVLTLTPSSTAVGGSWTSYTKETVSTSSNDLNGQFFSAAITSATTGRTATISFSGAGGTFVTVAVWLLNVTSGVLELVAEANGEGNSTTPDGGTLSNAGADSVCSFMMMLEYSASTHTATGWTEDFDLGGSDNYTAGYSRGAETTTSIDPAGTQSSSAAWGVISLCFKEGSAGASVSMDGPGARRFNSLRPRVFAPGGGTSTRPATVLRSSWGRRRRNHKHYATRGSFR